MQRKGVITAVAVHKKLLLGQRVRLEGNWTKHDKYGLQLQVRLRSFPFSHKVTFPGNSLETEREG